MAKCDVEKTVFIVFMNLFLFTSCDKLKTEPISKPYIIIVMSDAQSWSDLHDGNDKLEQVLSKFKKSV